MKRNTGHHFGNIGLMAVLLVLLAAPFLGFGLMKVETGGARVLSGADVRQRAPIIKVTQDNLTEEATSSGGEDEEDPPGITAVED